LSNFIFPSETLKETIQYIKPGVEHSYDTCEADARGSAIRII